MHEEHAIQAFKRYDKSNTGHITAIDFAHIMKSIKSHLVTPFVKEHLVSVSMC